MGYFETESAMALDTAGLIGTVEITLAITPDSEGGFSAIALNLPGAGSCGETEVEAVENAREAIRAVLDMHADRGQGIPWREVTDTIIPESATLQRITLDV